jgi:hypothetical protein
MSVSDGGSRMHRTVADAVVAYMSESDMARKARELDALHAHLQTLYSYNIGSRVRYCSWCRMPRTDDVLRKHCYRCEGQVECCGSIYCMLPTDYAPPADSVACPKCVDESRCPLHTYTVGACDVCDTRLCLTCYEIRAHDLTICSRECLASLKKRPRIRDE